MKKITKFLLIPMLVLLWGFTSNVYAQPGCGNTDSGTITPTLSHELASYAAGDTYYWTFSGVDGETYSFSSCSAGEDTYLRVYDVATGTVVASNDDNGVYCSGTSASLDFSCTSTEDYWVSLAHYSCNNLSNAGDLEYWSTVAASVSCGNTYSGGLTPTTTSQTVAYVSGDTYYWSFDANANDTYTFTSCTAGEDTYIRIYDGSGTQVDLNDDDGPHCSGITASIDYTPTTSGVYYVSLAHYSCNNLNNDGDFEYYYTPAPSCPDPTALTTSAITTSSATISWTAGGSETAWEYDYGLAGYGPPAGAGTAVGSATANLSGLTAATDYDWYVRADCGGGTYSDWVLASFTTACNTFVAPFSEDFTASGFPTCWSQTFDAGSDRWSQASTNNAGGAASGEMRCAYQNATGISRLISPTIDCTPLTTPQLDFTFFLNDYSSGMTFKVQTSIDGGANWVDESWSIVTGGGDIGPLSVSIVLSNYGANTLIAWTGDGNHYNFDYFYIDDVVVDEAPSCPDPSDQSVSGITTTSADLAWIENGTATTWDIELGATGFAPTGTPTQSGVTNPYTYGGLTAATTYDWYVRSDCGSNWVGPNTFTTACVPLSIPYAQDFDSGVEWPTCWSEGGDDVFSIATVFDGAGSSVYASYNSQGHGYLYSPEFDATSSSDLHVRFFHYWRANYSNETQDGLFYGSPDGGATVYLLDEWHHNNPGFIFGWNEYDISSWADGASNLTFWFDLDMGDDYYWIIDYFAVQEGAFSTHGQWTGATDTDWHTASNWADGIVPFSLSDVTIPTGLTNYPTASAAGYYVYMDVASDATGDASLLTGGNLTMTTGGTATVHRYVTTDQWHLLGTSTTGNESGMFGGDYLESHDEGTNVYSYISSTHVALPMGTGYAYYDVSGAGNNDNNYSYTGTLSSGESISLARSAAGSNNGWNLVANPFPSAIDWDAATGWTKTNVGGTVYYYNGTNWATWNGTTGVNGGNQYIPMGQGFFVTVNDDGSTTGTLGIDYDAQVHNGQAFWKGDNFPTNAVRVAVSSANGTDEMVVNFNENATTEFDNQLDAYKLMNLNENAPNIYAITDVMYSINTTPAVKSMPVNVNAIAGTYTISKVEGDLQVTLEDTYTGEFTDLNAGDYTFEYAENQDARFVLHFGALSVEEDLANIINVFDSRGSIVVTVPSNVDAQISVLNVLGQEVANVKAVDGQTVINVENDATYLVQIISNGTIVTEKVFVK